MKFLCLLILSFLLSPVFVAQTKTVTKPEASLKVEQVVIHANKRFSRSTIKSWIGVHRGSTYDPQQIDNDLHALFATGYFEDVKVFADKGLHGGKISTFVLKERPQKNSLAFAY